MSDQFQTELHQPSGHELIEREFERDSFASWGNGSSGHLSMKLFKAMTKTDFAHISCKGAGQSLQDVITGRVPVTFNNLTPILLYIKEGALIPLGGNSGFDAQFASAAADRLRVDQHPPRPRRHN